ncbi:MAG: hypothetical protein KAJ19_18425 [Gammaproteobacteria bacterium]|nr:hypothetical protein [Gammaproteobacteria bacterium]
MAFPSVVYLSYGQEKVETSEQKQKLGTKGVLPDGRVFYYAKNSSTAITTAGQIVDGIAAVAAHDMDLAAAAASAGATSFTSGTSLTVTKNQYADGYVLFNDGPAQGEVYRIKSNTAVSSATGLEVTIDEPDGLRTALTTSSLFGLVYPPYKDVKIIDGDGTMTTGPLGVNPIPVTASYYFWLQTAGVSSVLSGAAVAVVGDAVGVSQASGESGAFDLWDVSANEDTAPIGTAMGIPSVDTDNQIVMLSIRN